MQVKGEDPEPERVGKAKRRVQRRESGVLRVNRGGGWNDFAKNLRSAYRATLPQDSAVFNVGFRLVRNAAAGSGTVTGSNLESTGTQGGTMLIAYFSWGGNTRGIAEEIQAQTGADLFEIQLVEPYSTDYNTVLEQAQQDQNAQARPELSTHVEDKQKPYQSTNTGGELMKRLATFFLAAILLLSDLCALGYHTERQTGYLKKVNELLVQLPNRTQMDELLKAVKHLEQMSEQAGKQSEKRFSLPNIRLPRLSLPDIPWTSLLLGLAALALTGLVLWVVWSSLDTLWSAAKTLLP